MKKLKFSIVEKRLIRGILVFVLIQALIVFTFLRMLNISQPINNIEDTNQADIIVDDIYLVNFPKDLFLVIIGDTEKYIVRKCSSYDEYSLRELCETISKGDKLILNYYEGFNHFEKVNSVVAARSETEIYRSIEEFNRGRRGLFVFVIVLFCIIELIFLGIVFIYGWLNYSTIKGVYKKTQKRLIKKKENE